MSKEFNESDVVIIIVTFNSSKVIKNCLDSIPELIGKVIVVDNNSSDNTCEIIKNHHLNIQIIKNKKNIGFGRANNIALKTTKSPYALLLNPDAVLYEDTISHLVASSINNKDASIIAPVIYNEDGTIQHSFKDNVFKREKQKKKPCFKPDEDIESEYISGAVMLLKMKYFKKIGFFDEEIFLFYEDDDLCLRSNANGYYNIISSDAKVTHLMGKSSPINMDIIKLKNEHMIWSRLYLEEKHFDKNKARFKAFIYIYSHALKYLGYTITLNHNKMTKHKAKALAAYSYFLDVKISETLPE